MVENWIYIFHQKGLHGHWIKILLLLRSIALHRMNFWTKKNEKKWEKRILKFPIEFSSLVVTKNVWTCGCFYFCLNERGKLELVTCLKKLKMISSMVLSKMIQRQVIKMTVWRALEEKKTNHTQSVITQYEQRDPNTVRQISKKLVP